MPIYKAKTTCFVGKAVRHKGESFEYNGAQNDHLERVAGSESTHSPPKAMPETIMPEAVPETKPEVVTKVEQEIVDTKQDLEPNKRPGKPQANKA
ncbi:hypothetical protein [Bartonella queenslandensis]|uniref:hypothetical protein n=1 Tax=Bartonella queenslandensis TaxID=481138 RepID=UPI0002D7E20E|nr:hypothetical protein [Bartonella queenslandensis]